MRKCIFCEVENEAGILGEAQRELAEEKFKEAVNKKKEQLRTKKSLLVKLFPYKIVLVKR